MSPPIARPIPRFIADASIEGLPYGRWAQQLREALAKAAEPHASEAGGPLGEVTWFPERSWGGRVFIPAIAPIEGAEGEYFGYISFVRAADGQPSDIRAEADFTDVVVEDNPDWQIDLNEEVVGAWRGEGERRGDVTLVWGTPMVRGAQAATAELDGDVVDQAPVSDERFTLIALDAVKGFPDELYLEIRLWGPRNAEIARESLYEPSGGE
ncbi:MAG TPA: hypothetical protein VFN15_05265 [Solirubrobacterales bacterium]|nr:hypothetical protein [Solirubrobacterales bacterium]